MITTPESVLQSVSGDLRESSTDTSSRRLGYFNKSVRHVLGKYKWSWSKKVGTLDTDANVQEYNMSTEFSDYNELRGIYEVYVEGKKIAACAYENRNDAGMDSATLYYIAPDNKTIGFTKTLDGTEDIKIWYYASYVFATSYNSTLNIALPDEIGGLVGTYMLFLEHRSKKQRNDARNAMIDFTDLLDDLRPQDASNKSKDAKKTIPPFMAYHRFRRRYSN